MSIRDTGVGMTQQTIENILSGTENSTLGTANEKGFGLGLKFAIEFIELTQGKLEIESTPGKGSLFRLSYQK
jgi:signal transduction histidine kinase